MTLDSDKRMRMYTPLSVRSVYCVTTCTLTIYPLLPHRICALFSRRRKLLASWPVGLGVYWDRRANPRWGMRVCALSHVDTRCVGLLQRCLFMGRWIVQTGMFCLPVQLVIWIREVGGCAYIHVDFTSPGPPLSHAGCGVFAKYGSFFSPWKVFTESQL